MPRAGITHLDTLCATISIVSQKLSPPVRLRDAVKHWTDLPFAEILVLMPPLPRKGHELHFFDKGSD
jgi:hypothetical protein